MALPEPANASILERMREVREPLTWQQWVSTMSGIVGMKSGKVQDYYMTQKFGRDWKRRSVGLGPKSERGGSEPPRKSKRVWGRSPQKGDSAEVRASTNVGIAGEFDAASHIVGEQILPESHGKNSPERRKGKPAPRRSPPFENPRQGAMGEIHAWVRSGRSSHRRLTASLV